MLRQPSPALQEGKHRWPRAQEKEGGAHDGNGAPFVFYDEHVEALFDGEHALGFRKRAFNHLQAAIESFQVRNLELVVDTNDQ